MAVHNRLADKQHPNRLSPVPNAKKNPLSSVTPGRGDHDGDDKKKAAMLAAFKGKH